MKRREFDWHTGVLDDTFVPLACGAPSLAKRVNASVPVHPDFMQTVHVPKDATRVGKTSRKSLLKSRKKQAIARGVHPTPDEIVFSDTPGIIDDGNFSYGVCHVCEWKGSGRRAREKARRDAAEHYLLAH